MLDGALRNVEYSFIVIIPRSTLVRRTVWHLDCVQTNDLCQIEQLEIELFDHLTVCKQMTAV